MISPSIIKVWLFIVALAATLLMRIPLASAQDGSDTEPPEQRIASVQFSGNSLFTDFQLRTLTRTKANREFLQIPGFRWWLWIYQLGAPGKTIFGRALMSTGEPPSAYQTEIVEADIERLRLFYLQEGFRRVQVDHEVIKLKNSPWVTVRFLIDKGPPTYIRQFEFTGVETIDSQVRSRIVSESLLSDASDSSRVPDRYSEPRLIDERTRIVNVLRNSGYAKVTRDSIRAIVFPFSPDSFDVTLLIGAGERYRFSNVAIDVEGPEPSSNRRSDTLRTIVVDDGRSLAFVTADYRNESQLESSLLRRSLQFRPGEWYNQSKLTATKQRLESSGIFTYTNIQPESIVDTLSGSPALPTEIELRTRRRHQIRLETFMLQRGGVLGGADTELGTGVGMSYRNLNTLGGGEVFRLRASGSVAADSDFRLFTSTQGEISATLLYPYLIFPFRGLDNRISLFDSRSRFSLTLLAARRDQLKLVIRGRGNMRFRLELQHTPTIASLIDVIDLSVSNPDTIRGFNNEFLEPLLSSIGDDPLQRARILEDYTSPQINNALRYTFRSANVNPLRREEGYSYDLSGEVGGTLPSLLDRFVFTPDSVEGSLPALPFFGSRETDPRLIYRPYVRFVADLRQYRRMNRVTVVAFRALGGVVHPIGGSPVAPFDKRFFSGGAFSVRGWQLGELGPGSVELEAAGTSTSTETTNILGGDIKLESSVEMRTTMFTNILAADWIFAMFGDAGNIWFGPRNPGIETEGEDDNDGQFRFGSVYKQIGIGSGLGIRIAWEYFIARIDLGYKVYDPSRSVRGFYPDGLSEPVLHFGIGHTF